MADDDPEYDPADDPQDSDDDDAHATTPAQKAQNTRLRKIAKAQLKRYEFPRLRIGTLVPAWDESRHGCIVLHPMKAFEEEIACQRRTGRLDLHALQDSMVTIYRCTPQVS